VLILITFVHALGVRVVRESASPEARRGCRMKGEVWEWHF